MLKPAAIYKPKPEEVAARLRGLAQALDKSPSEMADDAGIARNAWSQFTSEKEPRVITLNNAYRLIKYGVTLDWIYRGDDSGIKLYLVRSLNAVPVPIVGRIPSNSQD